jgi:hypothetical protein
MEVLAAKISKPVYVEPYVRNGQKGIQDTNGYK